MSTSLDIQTLYDALRNKLGLQWESGKSHGSKIIHNIKDSTPDLSLVGHLNLINPNCIQVLGSKELECQSRLVIVANHLKTPADLKSAAASSDVPVLSAQLPSQETIRNLQHYLGNFFAEKITLHGVFMEVMGTGVLITGESSIGKSELALELLTRGHRLIADDATEFARLAPDVITGSCPEMLRDFIEVRGLGILNVRAMFGASAIKNNRNLRLIIVLQDMDEAIEMDRLHGSKRNRRLMNVDIPEITLPVGPGRNLSVLVEAAVRNHILHTKGYDASKAFIERQKRRLENAHE
jgi:HPr kinase/phosphorylase